MDDVVICGQLRQIFPQVAPGIIQKTVEQAKANEGVDILTHCIEVVLAYQEAGNQNQLYDSRPDDIVFIGARKREKSNGLTKDIPVVFVNDVDGRKEVEDDVVEVREFINTSPPEPLRPFSGYRSGSSSSTSTESSEDETVYPKKHTSNKSYIESNKQLRDEFYDEQLDNFIANMKYIEPESESFDKEHVQTFADPAGQPTSSTPGRHHLETPGHQPVVLLPCTAVHQALQTPSQYHSVSHGQQPSGKLNRYNSATPSRNSLKPGQHSAATSIPKPHKFSVSYKNMTRVAETHTQQPSTTLNLQSPPIKLSTTATTSTPFDVIKQMYPRVNTEFVETLSQQGYDLNGIVNVLLDRPDMQNSGTVEKELSPKEPARSKGINYFTDFSSRVVKHQSILQCETLLRNEFQQVSVLDIRAAMHICHNHYAPAHKLLEEALLDMNQTKSTTPLQNDIPSSTRKKKFAISRLLGSKRPRAKAVGEVEFELKQEVDFVKKQAKLDEEKKNAIYAASLNKQQYEDEGELIECGCCFGEFPFEEIVQCCDGHLFCKGCLHGYAKEIIFGSAMASVRLVCMGEDCGQSFPYSQLEKCLTKDEIEKYRSRLQEDCLAKADIPNLHKCPFCDFAAIVPEQQRVFACMNPKCLKESCTECDEEWKDHFGKKCNEVEKKSQTKLRLSYEERMTMAKVRKCSKCSVNFTKLDGCNKMTCRCGTTQCYVCRKSSINYDHFCRHPRDPGKKCSQCLACSLWTDPTEDDELAIKQLQGEAALAKRKLMEDIEQSTSKKKKHKV